MPLYFAYGANMDVDDMARRCPRSRPLGLARLMRHRLAIMREGWLTATRDPQGRVHGVLWDLALADVPALDRFEGLGDGLYAKVIQPVVAAGGPKRALVYFGRNDGPGRAEVGYIREVIAAARHWRLPEDGLAALEGFARDAGVGDIAAPRVRPRFARPSER
jgi:hypothetical protein